MTELLKTIKGSQVYGTTVDTSDTDYISLYKHDVDTYLSNHYTDFIETSKDDVSMEIGKFIHLCTKGSPIQLEPLFTPERFILDKHPKIDLLFENKELFLTKKLKYSYTGFVKQQLHKAKNITKRLDWERNEVKRKTVLDFCYVVVDDGVLKVEQWCNYYNIPLDRIAVTKLNHSKEGYLFYTCDESGKGIAADTSNNLRCYELPKDRKGYNLEGTLLYNADVYSAHCKKYREYKDWLDKRNPERYKAIKKTGSIVDLKFFYHAIRLLNSCEELLTENTIHVDRRGRDAEYLIKIRKGEVSLQELNEYAEEKLILIEDLYDKCTLPDTIDMNKVSELVIEMRK